MRRRQGFTLLEIMISLVIVATALLVLQGIITDNLDRTENALKQRTARTLARQKLEEYLASDGEGSTSGGFDDDTLSDFSWSVQREDVSVGETGSIVRVTLTVRYDSEQRSTGGFFSDEAGSGSGQGSSFALSTFISAPEEQ